MPLIDVADAEPRRSDARAHAALRFLAPPNDIDAGGTNAQAGYAPESWIDRAGFAFAAGWSGFSCVTASVGNAHVGEVEGGGGWR